MSKLCMHCTGRDHLHDPGCPMLGQPPARPHPAPSPIPPKPRDYLDLGGPASPDPSSNVAALSTQTRLDIDPLRVLQSAGEAMLNPVLVVGIDKSNKPYFASSTTDARQILWQLEKARHFLLTQMA